MVTIGQLLLVTFLGHLDETLERTRVLNGKLRIRLIVEGFSMRSSHGYLILKFKSEKKSIIV